jgi:hypothetical protein
VPIPSPIWAVAALAVTALPSTAAADRRSFTRTHEYMTTPRGETEIVLYSTHTQATFTDDSPESFELQLEIDHGITDRWDVALRHVFDQSSGSGTLVDPGEPFHFAAMMLQARYRLVERGELPVDAVAIVEGTKRFGGSVYEVAATAVLARDLGRLSLAIDPSVRLVVGGDVPEPEVALAWAAGATYDVLPSLKAGAETWGGFELDAAGEAAVSAGPVLSWAPVATFWIAVNAGFGLNDNADRLSVRALVGMDL